MGRGLTVGAEGLGFKMQLECWVFHEPLSVRTAVNGYLTVFRAGASEGGEEEEWRTTSVTPLPLQAGSLAATSRRP